MADKRIHELTDEQASYSPSIKLAVDDATFTNTKKMNVSTIYPKTNTLSAVGNFNPVTTLWRMDNGSGSETKGTVNNVLSDADVIATITSNIVGTPASVASIATAVTAQILGASSEIAFPGTPDSNFTNVVVNGRQLGDVFAITGTFTAAAATGLQFLKNVTGWVSPGFEYNFAVFHEGETVTEGGWGYLTTDLKLYMAPGRSGNYRFGLCAVAG